DFIWKYPAESCRVAIICPKSIKFKIDSIRLYKSFPPLEGFLCKVKFWEDAPEYGTVGKIFGNLQGFPRSLYVVAFLRDGRTVFWHIRDIYSRTGHTYPRLKYRVNKQAGHRWK
ncbi:hypothetical protein ACFL35_21015, partial [Candidatus Riflebacteria bacterium]